MLQTLVFSERLTTAPRRDSPLARGFLWSIQWPRTTSTMQFGERAMKFTVTSGAGVTEVIDRPASARAALELVLALLGRTRTDVPIFDEDGRRRSPADLCRLAADEVAMLPDESELSF
jgi:hypothetical protein